MQFIPALFAATPAAAGATAAAGGAGVLGTGISATALLSGGATVLGALATIGAGNAQARSFKQQAQQTELESLQDQTQATQKQTAMKRELMRVMGDNTVTSAAAGIDLGAGLAEATAQDVKQRAATELSIDRASADARRAMFRARAAGFRQMAKQAKRQGLYEGLGMLAQEAIGMQQRG